MSAGKFIDYQGCVLLCSAIRMINFVILSIPRLAWVSIPTDIASCIGIPNEHHESLLCTCLSSLFTTLCTATISKDECKILNDILGNKTPSGCDIMSRNSTEDPFTIPGADKKFEGRDETKHRNSWLMPRMARRMTKNNKYHVSNWRDDVTVTEDECNNLAAILSEKLGEQEARANLPKACQKMM
jgi:hypothetical protein